MRRNRWRLILVWLFVVSATVCLADQPKPRLVVLTDVSTGETDDSESLVRLLVHADLLEIEGLVFTTGWSLETTRDELFDLQPFVDTDLVKRSLQFVKDVHIRCG